jgi:tetratricopeptide (TPR) repeat protein
MRFKDAADVYTRAVELFKRGYGDDSDGMAEVLAMRADMLMLTGHRDEAIADSLRSLAIKRRLGPADSPVIAERLEWLGHAQRVGKRFDAALGSYAEALAIRSRQAGHEDEQGAAELGMGGTLTDAGRPAEAVPHLERAIRWASQPGDHEETTLPESHAELGRAELLLHQRARGVALLKQARDEYAMLPKQADHDADLAEITKMLADAGATVK